MISKTIINRIEQNLSQTATKIVKRIENVERQFIGKASVPRRYANEEIGLEKAKE